ncbi:hypothetical protein COOONC_17015 [Cooperia oncophora]
MSSGEKCYELYKISESSPEFDAYLTRVQSLALWYIDAAQYTDNSDPLWFHYFLLESRAHEAGDGSRAYSLAGYASLYRFYAHPDRVRPRIAQIMLLPPYRKSGLGAKLLDAIYKDLCSMKEVLDVTAEDPADNFVYLRDYVDCINCSKLPEFDPCNLKKGFTEEMRLAALNKLKITKRQSRRVYEILRLKCTNMKDAVEAKEYRLDVKRRFVEVYVLTVKFRGSRITGFCRLEAPMRRNERDWKKIQRALDDNEYAQCIAIYQRGSVRIVKFAFWRRMDEFSFPFPPYNIQLDLMREIKECIEKQQVGIFESPTGTGKSLSVLCATMTWLEEFEKRTEEELEKESRLTEEVSDDGDWISAHKKKLEIMKIKDEAYEKLKVLEKVKEKIYQARAGVIKRDRKRRLRDEGITEEHESENDAIGGAFISITQLLKNMFPMMKPKRSLKNL